jgi:hypothetical protein
MAELWPQLEPSKFASSALCNWDGKRPSLPESKLWELVRMVRTSYDASQALEGKDLTPSMRTELMRLVRRPSDARQVLLLMKYKRIPSEGQDRMERVMVGWVTGIWVMRVMALTLTIGAWVWHLPDLHTIAVLTATAIGIFSFLPWCKEKILNQ